MEIINNYDGASIELEKINENEAFLSLIKEGSSYGYYYNFRVKNNNKNGIIHIKNFEKSPYFIKENIPIPYTKRKGKWEKINQDNFDCNNEKDIVIKILPNEEEEISLFPRYNKQDLEKFFKKIKDNNNVFINENLNEIILGNENKPAIVVTARQHPGETLSSFFIEGMIEQIISNPKFLDKNCFIIYPIVSINGVKNGNHRLTDNIDYNRSWGNETLPKEIKYIQKRMNEISLKMFIDVHCDEVTKKDYIRTNKKSFSENIAGIQILEDMSKPRRFLRALIKQRKIIKFSNLTAREYISKKYKCENMLIELTLNEDENVAKNKGKNFVKELMEG